MQLSPRTLGLFPRDEYGPASDHASETFSSTAPPQGHSVDRGRLVEVVEDQLAAGFDGVHDGQLQWTTGLAHPLVTADGVTAGDPIHSIPGTETAPQPIIDGPLQAGKTLAGPLETVSTIAETVDAIIPGPYTLLTIADNRYYEDSPALLDGIADLLADELRTLPPHRSVIVHEPGLIATPPPTGIDARVQSALDTLTMATDSPVIVVPYGGVLPEKVHAHILDADIAAISYDLLADHHASIELIAEYGTTSTIGFCVIDPTARSPPSVEQIRDRITWVREVLPDVIPLEDILLIPNGGLERVNRERVRTVLASLGQAAKHNST